MRILIDMDDTIEQLLKRWIEYVNEKYGYHATIADALTWDVSAMFPGLSKKQVYDVILENDFWMNVDPIEYADVVIKKMMDAGHEVYIVTATPYQSVVGKMEHVLFKYFPFITWDKVIITTNKHLLKGDIMIDDGVHNLEGGDYIKILIDMPYNHDYDDKTNDMIRVHDWYEIEKVLDEIVREK